MSVLIKANHNHIKQIQQLADKIWKQHYPNIISKEQIGYMLDLMYSESALQTQIETQGISFYLINRDEKNIGFLSVSFDKELNCYNLHKFYIDQNIAGYGLGTKAFNQLVQELNPEKIKLTVNRQNYKSINFYFKLGFTIEQVADFDIGNGYVMNDFVMVWKKRN
jgi:RimJ/RimL family protein N-acetyltransferase